jgi:hypothetical protein
MAGCRTLGIIVLLAGVFAQCGCVTSYGTAGRSGSTFAHHLGQGTGWFEADFADTWLAARESLEGLALPIKGEQRHRLTGTIESAMPSGTTITLELEEKPLRAGMREHQTEVRVRVGLFGDQQVSEHLLEQIQLRLAARKAALPPPPVPSPNPAPPPVPPQEKARGR